MGRSASIERNTLETQITVSIDLDGGGKAELDTGVPFLEHMIDQIARHGLVDIAITAKGDLHIDAHHTVEDIGITLGQAMAAAIGDKRGIRRYGHAYVPLDEALSRVVLDLSGRPGLVFEVPFVRGMIGSFDVDLFHEFFQGFVNHAAVTLHIDRIRGENAHHIAETVFKAFGRALRMALEADERQGGVIPSTKGIAKFWQTVVGQFLGQRHRHLARTGEGAHALGPDHVAEADIVMVGDLALDFLDRDLAFRSAQDIRQAILGDFKRYLAAHEAAECEKPHEGPFQNAHVR